MSEGFSSFLCTDGQVVLQVGRLFLRVVKEANRERNYFGYQILNGEAT